MLAVNPGNSVSQIKIYSGTEEYPRIIARLVNNLFEEGMLAHMDCPFDFGAVRAETSIIFANSTITSCSESNPFINGILINSNYS